MVCACVVFLYTKPSSAVCSSTWQINEAPWMVLFSCTPTELITFVVELGYLNTLSTELEVMSNKRPSDTEMTNVWIKN